MVKETITYEDFDGSMKTTDLYFHLTEAEITLLNIKNNNRFNNINKDSVSSIPVADQVELFEKIIEKAYGQKLADGTFVKDDTARKAFLCSPAYSAFLMKFISGEIDAQKFILSCFSKSISKRIEINENGEVSAKEE